MLGSIVMAMWLEPSAVNAIEWTAPDGCPDDAAVEARIAAVVDVSGVTSATVASVRADAQHFEVDLVSFVDGEPQRRTLDAPTCDVLADAVAVVVAFTIDPANAEAGVDPAPEPDPVPEAPGLPAGAILLPSGTANTVVGRRPDPPEADVEPRQWDVGFRLEAGYGSGVAPIGSGVLGFGFAVGRGRGAIEATARLWIPRNFTASTADYGARVVLGTGAVAGCLRTRPDRKVDLPLCLGIEAGSLSATGRGLDLSSTEKYPWVAPLARVGFRVKLGVRVGVGVVVEAAVPVFRAALDVVGGDRIWATRGLSVRAMPGLDLRW